MITANEIYQLQEIIFAVIIICYMAYRCGEMEFGFTSIVLNLLLYVFHGIVFGKWHKVYLVPLQWIKEQYLYLAFALVATGSFYIMMELFVEFRLHQVNSKTMVAFAGFPLLAGGIIGICVYYEHIVSRRSKRFKHAH